MSDYNDTEKVVEAVKTILRELNGGNKRAIANAIHETVRSDHRTIQQAFWSAILTAQMNYADAPHDLRNEAAVELAKAVDEVAKRHNWDLGLPFI